MLISSSGEPWKNAGFEEVTTPLDPAPPKFRPWTDDYNNLFQILRLHWGASAFHLRRRRQYATSGASNGR